MMFTPTSSPPQKQCRPSSLISRRVPGHGLSIGPRRSWERYWRLRHPRLRRRIWSCRIGTLESWLRFIMANTARALSGRLTTTFCGVGFCGTPVGESWLITVLCLVVLNWLEAVKTIDHRATVLPPGSWTGSEWKGTFAQRAFDFYQIAHQGWDETLCDGGMVWSPVCGPEPTL
jgi:hypothetical protein